MPYSRRLLHYIFPTIFMTALILQSSSSAVAESKINVIPAPQIWTAGTGNFDITSAGLTCPSEQLALIKPILDQFNQDLVSIGAVKPHLPVGRKSATIAFVIKAQKDSKPGQYTLTIKLGRIIATAPTTTGLFYASQSLLQLAMQSPKLPCGTMVDYRVRSLMLDVGRKFFPYETLKDYVRTMGFLKLNELHLHISDNSFGAEIYPGFRIECDTLPELTNKDGFYTKTQIRELQDFARLRGIVVTP